MLERPTTNRASDITTSSLAIGALKKYATGDRKPRAEKRIEDCQQWFDKQSPEDTEERVFRLFAAIRLNQADVVHAMRDELLRTQRSDGGWGQTDTMDSDAYATGTALVALAQSGMAATDAVYQRGLAYLSSQQLEDGSWHVKTRSKPIQKYFESGFPHGVDQFISVSATCWSVLAMLHALPASANATDTSPNILPEFPWHRKEQARVAEVPKPDTRVATAEQIEFFEREVRPVLLENCASCHGPEKQSGGLRVDQLSALIAGGDSGPAIVPHAPEKSLLVKAIKRSDELKMPPDDPLSQSKVERLERWIQMGAPWPADAQSSIDRRKQSAQQHWAFQPVRATVPPSSPSDWSRGPVDAYIADALQQKGLTPRAQATRRQLLRRVTYDLIGLPPSDEELSAFEQDISPDALERRVDRLLSSPKFGEHWGRHWLDVARYSDSKGYVYAREERFFIHAPAYRDWVIDALSSDMPYDRFLKLQIAADQLASDDPSQLAAMGFLTIGRRFLGVTHDIIDDRIDVVTRGVLGLTVGCARCHDHKFDPIPTQDYYSLYGVFLNCTENQVKVPARLPKHSTPDAEEKFEQGLAKRLNKLKDQVAQERKTAEQRVMLRFADYLLAQLDLSRYPAEGFDVIIQKDDLVPAQVRRFQAYLLACQESNDSIFVAWRKFIGLPADQFAALAPKVCEELQALSPAELNPHIARLFRTVPRSLEDVARRYAELLNSLENIECTSDAESRGLQALFELRESPASPCIVPDEDIVSIEQFFETRVCEALWKLQADVDRWIIQNQDDVTFATILRDRAAIREAHVFRRGNPLQIGDVAPRRFLAALDRTMLAPQVPSTNITSNNNNNNNNNSNGNENLASQHPRSQFMSGSGRRELAEALVDSSNPLTSRVWVNRIWQHLFDKGLVLTPSDFGLRAQPPSHPQLLDHLANQLIESQYSTKAIVAVSYFLRPINKLR